MNLLEPEGTCSHCGQTEYTTLDMHAVCGCTPAPAPALELLDLLEAVRDGDPAPVPACGRWLREARALGLVTGDTPELTPSGAFALAEAGR